MLELIILSVFCAGLVSCILLNISTIYALLFGYALFFGYGLYKGHRAAALFKMSLSGAKTVTNILIAMLLIGVLTALWRAGGTIAFIIHYASRAIVPAIFPLIAFLLCCLISVLTGTSFGTAAIVGVICMTISNAMGISPVLTGGAILSGIFFGDRCSPMSTSALLVAELTGTDIYKNIRNMVRSSIGPFTLSCLLYLLLGLSKRTSGASDAVWGLFSQNFSLHWTVVIPAALVLILAALRVKVRFAMAASIAAAGALCVAAQGMDILTLLQTMLFGFHAKNAQLAAMMDGGGVTSMFKVIAIVFLSSCYAGIFNGTGLLVGIRRQLHRLGEKISPFGSLLITSVITNMAACNQTLSIMLTHQLLDGMVPDKERLALHLEDTAVVIAPLVPWSVASATPLATIGAPGACILAAFYLILLPLWSFTVEFARWKKTKRLQTTDPASQKETGAGSSGPA